MKNKNSCIFQSW